MFANSDPKLHFLSAWLRNPLQMGALLASSEGLAGAMAAQVELVGGTVLELGAGTGAITAALLARGISSRQLIVVEKDLHLAAQMRRRFPGLEIIAGDAARLRALLGPPGARAIDAVVSSLPLLSMRATTRTRTLAQVFALLPPGGKFVQFTYSPKPPVPESLARALGIRGRRVSRIFLNVPPASVWTYSRDQ